MMAVRILFHKRHGSGIPEKASVQERRLLLTCRPDPDPAIAVGQRLHVAPIEREKAVAGEPADVCQLVDHTNETALKPASFIGRLRRPHDDRHLVDLR